MKIKYCGLTNIEDVVEAVSLKVDYLGFIVEIPASPRSLNLKNIAVFYQGRFYKLLALQNVSGMSLLAFGFTRMDYKSF